MLILSASSNTKLLRRKSAGTPPFHRFAFTDWPDGTFDRFTEVNVFVRAFDPFFATVLAVLTVISVWNGSAPPRNKSNSHRPHAQLSPRDHSLHDADSVETVLVAASSSASHKTSIGTARDLFPLHSSNKLVLASRDRGQGFPTGGFVMAKMQSLKPARKVWVGSLVGAATTIVIWLIESIGKITVPGAVAVAISTLLSGIISYIVPPADADQVVST